MNTARFAMLSGLIAGGLAASHAAGETRQLEVHHWVRRPGGMERELLTRIPATLRQGSSKVRLRRERGGAPPEFVEVRFDRLDTPAATVRLTRPGATAPLAFEAGHSVVRLESTRAGWSLLSATAEGDDPSHTPAPGSWELEVEPGPRQPRRASVTVALAGEAAASPLR